MKRTAALALVLLLLLAVAAPAARADGELLSSGEFQYRLLEDGSAEIVRYNGKTDKTVVIPAELDGAAVTAVGDGVFNQYFIPAVELPATLRSIGAKAFSFCSLTELRVPEGVESIGMGAFSYCTDLERVALPDSLETMGDSVFAYCVKLSEIELSASHPRFELIDGALIDRDSRTLICCPPKGTAAEFRVPEGTVRIASHAFPGGTKIVRLTLPSTLTELGRNALPDWGELEQILVAADNPVFESIDGVLFDRREHALLRYPGGRTAKEYEVPAGTLVIGEEAFSGSKKLKAVSLPEGVLEIRAQPFLSCSAFEELRIPASVERMAENALYVAPGKNARAIVIGGSYAESFCREKKLAYSVAPLSGPGSLDGLGEGIGRFMGRYGVLIFIWLLLFGLGLLFFFETKKRTDKKQAAQTADAAAAPKREFRNSYTGALIRGVLLTAILIVLAALIRRRYPEMKYLNVIFGPAALYLSSNLIGFVSEARSLRTQSGERRRLAAEGASDRVAPDLRTESVSLPEGTERIEPGAYFEWKSLRAVELPDSVREIGARAFEYCEALRDAPLPPRLEEIGPFAFSRCYKLSALELPESLGAVGEGVFSYCTGVKELRLSEGLERIGAEAFSYCSSLGRVELPYSLTEIGGAAFAYSGLEELVLPETLRFVGNGAFRGCGRLRKLSIRSGSCVFDAGAFEDCAALEEVEFPVGAFELGKFMFSQCAKLSSVSLPEGLAHIPDGAFADSGLKQIVLPRSLQSIAPGAFRGCAGLESLVYRGSAEEWKKVKKTFDETLRRLDTFNRIRFER